MPAADLRSAPTRRPENRDVRGPYDTASRWALFFHASPNPLLILEDSGRVVDINATAAHLLASRPDYCLGLRVGDLEPSWGRALEAVLPGVLRDRRPLDLDHREPLSCGVWLHSQLRQLPARHGRAETVAVVCRDVTQERRVALALTASEEQKRLILDNALDAIFLVDPARMLIVEANQAAVRSYGWPYDELVGMSPLELSAQPELTRQVFGGLDQTSTLWVELRWHRRRDGGTFPVEITSQLFRAGDRSLLCSVVRDISQRLSQEDALRRELTLNQALAEVSRHLMEPTLDLERAARGILDACRRLTGAAAGLVDSLDPATGDLVNHAANLGPTRGPVAEGEERPPLRPNADGAYGGLWGHALNRRTGFFTNQPGAHPQSRGLPQGHLPLESFLAVPILAGGELLGQIALANKPGGFTDSDLDVVARVGELFGVGLRRIHAERQKNLLEGQLRRSQRLEAMGTLAGGIAHDFNNLLAAIVGYSELALEDQAPDGEAADNLARVLEASRRAKELVRQILSFGRQTERRAQPVSLGSITKETLKLLRSGLPSTISLHYDVRDQEAKVVADPAQIHQVLLNLCTNAALAMESTGGVLEVTLGPLRMNAAQAQRLGLNPGRYVELMVRDQGVGMDPEVLEHIFEPYFTTRPQDRGSGLGLSVAHGIVKAHGGAVDVWSMPGRGAEFRVYLPVFLETSPGGYVRRDEVLPRGRERIMLVDDEPALAELGARWLGRLGYRVTSYTSGREALAALKSDPQAWDLVLSDQTMPGLTGDQLAAQAVALRPELPVILYTGHSARFTAQQARELGVRRVLAKPLEIGELSRALRAVLDQDGR